MADTARPRTVRPNGEDPLTGAVWRLRSRGCWQEAGALLEPHAGREADAALRRAELLIERCEYTGEGWTEAEEALRLAESQCVSDTERGAAACERGTLAYVSTRLRVRDRTDEARAGLGRAAALLEPTAPGRSRLDFRRGLMAQHLSGSPQAAEAAYRRAHAEATTRGETLLLSCTWRQLGVLALWNGELSEARQGFTESLRLREATGFLVGIAPALLSLAQVQPEAEATRLRTEADRLSRLLGGLPPSAAD